MKTKEIGRKVLSVVVSSLIVGTATIPVLAADGYDREKAIAYAKANWSSSAKFDCARYVSKCIEAGGSSCYSASSSALHEQLEDSGEGFGFDVAFDGTIYADAYHGMIEPGDVVQFHCSECEGIDGKPWIHTTLVAGISDDGYLKCYSHSSSNDGSDVYYYDTTCWSCDGEVDHAWIYHFDDGGGYIPQTGSDPIGWLDSVEGGQGGVDIVCWAFDPDDTSIPIGFKVYFGGDNTSGAPYRRVDANDDRPDIRDYYTVSDTWHGCQSFVEAFTPGRQTVYVYAENYGGGEDKLLGSATVYIDEADYNAYASSSDISMKEGESKNITLNFPGDGRASLIYPYNSNEAVAEHSFGECTADHLPITITAKKAGTTELKYEFKTSGGQLLKTVTVRVTVTEKPSYHREPEQPQPGRENRWQRLADTARDVSNYARGAYEAGFDAGKKLYDWWSNR